MSMRIVAGIGLCTDECAIAGTVDVDDLPPNVRQIVVELREKLAAIGPHGDRESILENPCPDLAIGSQTWWIAIEDDSSGVVEFGVSEDAQAPSVTLTDHVAATLPRLPFFERMEVTERFEPHFTRWQKDSAG